MESSSKDVIQEFFWIGQENMGTVYGKDGFNKAKIEKRSNCELVFPPRKFDLHKSHEAEEGEENEEEEEDEEEKSQLKKTEKKETEEERKKSNSILIMGPTQANIQAAKNEILDVLPYSHFFSFPLNRNKGLDATFTNVVHPFLKSKLQMQFPEGDDRFFASFFNRIPQIHITCCMLKIYNLEMLKLFIDFMNTKGKELVYQFFVAKKNQSFAFDCLDCRNAHNIKIKNPKISLGTHLSCENTLIINNFLNFFSALKTELFNAGLLTKPEFDKQSNEQLFHTSVINTKYVKFPKGGGRGGRGGRGRGRGRGGFFGNLNRRNFSFDSTEMLNEWAKTVPSIPITLKTFELSVLQADKNTLIAKDNKDGYYLCEHFLEIE